MASKLIDKQANADALGNATIDQVAPPQGYYWIIRQINVSTNGALISQANVYHNNKFICGTISGNNDSADGQPMLLYPNDVLKVVWTNCTPTTTQCHAILMVDEMEI